MNGLISIENISLRPVSREILEINSFSSQYGLVLSEEEARELSDTRIRALDENDRLEIGVGPVTDIIKKFCTSKYITRENYTYVLNEVTYLFYYIKTETDDGITDSELLDELFVRFELYCRGSIDLLESREAERIIRKINSGENYAKWYTDRDELDYNSKTGLREAPTNVLDETYGEEYFSLGADTPADHDKYEAERDYTDSDDGASLDAYDEFLENAVVLNLDNAVFDPSIAHETTNEEEDE